MPRNNEPIQRIDAWPLSVAIWMREHEERTYYSATIQRSYKDGDEYKHTDSMNEEDLLLGAKLLDQAHSAILRLKQAEYEKRKGRR